MGRSLLKDTLRTRMLVIMGARAAYMECTGKIRLPSGLNGEDELAVFVEEAVNSYVDSPVLSYVVDYDEFIETQLMNKYGIEVSDDGRPTSTR